MDNLDQQIRKNAVIRGLIYGIIYLVINIGTFYYIISATAGFGATIIVPFLLAFLVPLVIVILLCFDLRKKIGGYWIFKQATTGIFIMLFVGYAINAIGRDFIFAKLIEPNMVEKTQTAMMNATRSYMEKTNTDPTTIDEKMDDIKKQFDAQKDVSIGKIIQSYAIVLIFLFVLALILGAMFKKPPLRSIDEPVV